jgi:hypothetical protein
MYRGEKQRRCEELAGARPIKSLLRWTDKKCVSRERTLAHAENAIKTLAPLNTRMYLLSLSMSFFFYFIQDKTIVVKIVRDERKTHRVYTQTFTSVLIICISFNLSYRQNYTALIFKYKKGCLD